ncbi:MAG: hypothetical protein KDE22_03885, partial [Rhodobacterales bacterium]|nr:hypothetical protein [Rhodobacterales bacterium]
MDENAHPPELFGPDGSVALMRRGAALWTLLRDNPRYAFYGRAIALCDPREDTADVLAAIAGLVGAAVANFLPKARADALFADLEGRGFTTDRHEHFWGGAAAHEASRRLLRDHALPADLSVVALGGDSPRPLVAEAAALCQACGVRPPPGATLRGLAN